MGAAEACGVAPQVVGRHAIVPDHERETSGGEVLRGWPQFDHRGMAVDAQGNADLAYCTRACAGVAAPDERLVACYVVTPAEAMEERMQRARYWLSCNFRVR